MDCMKNTKTIEQLGKLETIFRQRCLINPAHKATEEHHIIPKSQGGTDEPKNKVFLCRECHAMVHRKGSAVWRDILIELRNNWIEKYAI